MNTLDIKMRLLDVIEEREVMALKIKDNNSEEALEKYRALDKEKNELINALADGQAKTIADMTATVKITNLDKLNTLLDETAEKLKQIKNFKLDVKTTFDGEKEAAPEVEVQKQLEENFSPYTGEKLHDTCPNCWVKNNKPYNCGYDKCPGYKLFMLGK